ncbi:MAG: hypothetical protein HY692_07060 [Cyanobacteria bacterium NC_groundwater_1444_Ag_S-0.65um_54_12]|nr:hypothetical protein [Cyanobacteria bacterium NC_groundwater_1444_Ag_S-0.65um_54_12]
MDVSNFRTLGECEFGTIWFVEGENKVVVNAYQAALYFSLEDFTAFSKMVVEADRRFAELFNRKPLPASSPPADKPPASSKIRQFRPPNPSVDD